MKKSKISGKKTRFPSPFDTTTHKTEWTCAAKVAEWINDITKEKNIPLGQAEVETTTEGDRKRVDISIFRSTKSNKILCVIEMKQPFCDPFDEKELKEPAREKATKRKAKYFAVSNFKQLIWFNTERVNKNLPEEEQIHDKYTLSEIEDLDLIEEPRYKKRIISGLEHFLIDLYEVYTGKKPEPRQAIDEFLIYRLQQKIKTLSFYYRKIIEDKTHKDTDFSKKLVKWFAKQNWSFSFQEPDFDKAAHQAAYLLVNKILFYDLLQAKRPNELDPLTIPEDLTKGGLLQSQLQGYFDYVLNNIDYETIYTTDFIDNTAFPEHKEVVEEIKSLIHILKQYDFSKIGYDIIGRIFERLIPPQQRHNLGQYFTHPDIVDLILRFCLKHEKDKIMDPACGAGTFLVRAYQHKKLMNQRLNHQQILKTLWGCDIAKFPAHLSTINLAINDLTTDENYPQVMKEDFFNLRLAGRDEFTKKSRKKELSVLGKKSIAIPYPKIVDCVVGNPPYTRQEEISSIAGKGYKDKLIKNALYDIDGKSKLANLSKRAGIHGYFFIHGTKFLQNEGRFGFIVSNSWLDVDWGKGLQEFFLNNYKIIAIIGSKVERWFEEADINTCIVILEKCSGEKNKKSRDKNYVRFTYLKKPLRHFIPPAKDMWEKQKDRLKKVDALIKTILFHNKLYENEELRIFPKKQKELWEEGFDSEKNKYIGAKWGKYLRAPQIFFKILEKGKGKLVPLKEVADVRFGIKTGANEFFYLTEEEIKQKGIEREFWMHKEGKKWVPNYVIKSPRECKSIVVNPKDLKYRVLMIHKDRKDLKGTKVLKYIKEGERKGFHKRPTCASRKRWYDLGIWEKPDLIWSDAYNDRYGVYDAQKTWADKRFFYISLEEKINPLLLQAYLNSSIIPLLIEMDGITNLGEGVIYTNVYQLKKFGVPKKKNKKLRKRLLPILNQMKDKKIYSVFQELGVTTPEEVSLDKVKPDRRELDKIIMGKILGLTEDAQLEVYKAVVDLVKSRIEKAKTFGKRKKTKGGIDIDRLVKTVMGKIGEETLGKFYKEKILSRKKLETKKLPKHSDKIFIEQDLYGWRLCSGKKYIDCESEYEARYLKVWLEAGLEKVKIPKDEKYLENILPELETLKKKIDEIINSYLESILAPQTQTKIQHHLWQEILK
jgi:type I restriction enzyme M protein